MKRFLYLVIVITVLYGCSKTKIKDEVIEDYEKQIEDALLMTNGYQDSKYTSIRTQLEKYLASANEQGENLYSDYEGLTLDEALEYYNEQNGTDLINVTEKEAPEVKVMLEEIKERQEQAPVDLYQPSINSNEEELNTSDNSITCMVKRDSGGFSEL